jgi:SOS-response transcriptional repressor LexA
MKKPLTPRQQECLNTIEKMIQDNDGFSIGFRDLQRELGYSSPSPLTWLLKKLAEANKIAPLGKRRNAIQLPNSKVLECPDFSGLKPKHAAALTAIVQLTNDRGMAPTLREIATQLDLSRGGTQGRLERLRGMGLVSWSRVPRSIRVIGLSAVETEGEG